MTLGINSIVPDEWGFFKNIDCKIDLEYDFQCQIVFSLLYFIQEKKKS